MVDHWQKWSKSGNDVEWMLHGGVFHGQHFYTHKKWLEFRDRKLGGAFLCQFCHGTLVDTKTGKCSPCYVKAGKAKAS
jgi:hypothetical protein